MNKKILFGTIIIVLLAVVLFTTAGAVENENDDMYQVSLLQSFMHGEYDGVITVDELKSHGDTGLGTFNGVNGEMIVLDGHVYRARTDGTVEEVSDDTVPFASVTNFDEDASISSISAKDFEDLTSQLDKEIEKYGKDYIYLIKIDAHCDELTVRSVEKQEKPYKEFTDVAATSQKVFNYTNIDGTIIAVYFPEYMNELNMHGWHLHFLSDDKTKGGHVLNLTNIKASASIDEISSFDMILPKSDTFKNMDFSENMDSKINSVE